MHLKVLQIRNVLIVFPLVSTYNSNKYLCRWTNTGISFGLKLSLLPASHIFHWWVLLTCRPACWEHQGVSSCLQSFPLFTGSLPGAPQAVPSTSTTELVHLLPFHRGTIWGSFSGGQQYCQSLVQRDALQTLQEPDKRLNQMLSWHHFNYSVGWTVQSTACQCCCSFSHPSMLFRQQGVLINYCRARSVDIVLCQRTGHF